MEELKRQAQIICCYARVDQSLKNDLLNHLAKLNAHIFHDQAITAGSEWRIEIDTHLNNADIVLLLISSDFMASENCQVEIEKAIKRHKTRPICIISIILRECLWEVDATISNYQVLPSDGKPVMNWGDKDAAFTDITRGIKKVIDDILAQELQETLEQETKSRFDPLREIALFKYLVATNNGNDRIAPRRALMRFMLEQSKAGNYSINQQEIFREMQEFLDERTDLRTDLAFLVQHRNLNKTRGFKDTGDGLIEKFEISDEFIYTASHYALEIEGMIDGWRYSRPSGGALDRTKLVIVQKNLQELNTYLSRPEDLSFNFLHTIQETWNQILDNWKQLSRDIWLYLSNLENDARKDLYNLEAYNNFKSGIRNYIERFEKSLTEIAPGICEIFATWTDREKERLVLYISTKHAKFGSHEEERQISPAMLKADIYQHIASIQNWFLVQVPQFHRQARHEIHHIVSQARMLSAYFSNRLKNATYLQELANICLECNSAEEAQQVFMLAFAHIQPLYFSQSALPEPGIVEETDTVSPWLAPAPYKPVLRLISREKQNTTTMPIIEKSEQKKTQRDLQQSGLQNEADDWNMLKQLLASLPLDLGSLIHTTIDATFSILLEQIISNCLNDPDSRYAGRDGSIIVLRNPSEQRYIHICVTNGVFYLPRYTLDHIDE